MAKEAPPQPPVAENKNADIREVTMTKTDPVLDNPRLTLYKQLGYEISDESWYFRITGSQKEFEARQRSYQHQGEQQSGDASRARDSEGGDSDTERTISTISRISMTAAEILGDEGEIDD